MFQQRSLPRATLGALGVVYGDIGTSPLYALKEATAAAGGARDPAAVLGVLSLIFWSLFLVVTLKYVVLILRADNAGKAEPCRCSPSCSRSSARRAPRPRGSSRLPRSAPRFSIATR